MRCKECKREHKYSNMLGMCRTCYNRDYRKRNPERFRERAADLIRRPNHRFTTAKKTARYRGLSFTLDYETYKKLLRLKCEYCRGPLAPTGVGLDRKDNSLGYEPDNVTPCCGACNRIKGDILTYDEMRAAMRAVKSVRRKKMREGSA